MKPVLTEDKDVLFGIKMLCTDRHYNCRGCPYSAKKTTVLAIDKFCIFANCPCDWEIKEKE